MATQTPIFNILQSVDSSNNYAMSRIHAGLASDGEAWLALHQTGGKGQRGKTWNSAPGESVLLSVALRPPKVFNLYHFHFHAVVSLTVARFLESLARQPFSVKWPNDIYFNDRKAGGILIENIIAGSEWKWAVVGIGINVHQENFPENLSRATSLKMITREHFDTEALGQQLHAQLINVIQGCRDGLPSGLMDDYRKKMYRLNETVKLKKNNMIFETTIKGVDDLGRLITHDAMERHFTHGSVEWLL